MTGRLEKESRKERVTENLRAIGGSAREAVSHSELSFSRGEKGVYLYRRTPEAESGDPRNGGMSEEGWPTGDQLVLNRAVILVGIRGKCRNHVADLYERGANGEVNGGGTPTSTTKQRG